MHKRIVPFTAGLVFILSMGVFQAPAADPGLYAVFVTSLGGFTCRLEQAHAPRTTANFVGLAEGSNVWVDFRTGENKLEPYYDGTIFHRVVSNFVIQGGARQVGDSMEGPGYSFRDEFYSELKHDSAGVLSMANSGPNTQASQFFVTIVTNYSSGDGKYSVFGHVTDGMDVVQAINRVPVTNERPIVDVVLSNVVIVRVGAEAEAFDTSACGLPVVTGTTSGLRRSATNLCVTFSRFTNSVPYFFFSSNLVSWSGAELAFTTSAVSEVRYDVTRMTTNANRQFFHMTQINYPVPVYTPVSPEGWSFHMQFTNISGTFSQWLCNNATGTWKFGSSGGSILYYSWLSGAYLGRLYVVYDMMEPLLFDYAFDIPESNRVRMTVYSSSVQYWGTYTNGPR